MAEVSLEQGVGKCLLLRARSNDVPPASATWVTTRTSIRLVPAFIEALIVMSRSSSVSGEKDEAKLDPFFHFSRNFTMNLDENDQKSRMVKSVPRSHMLLNLP